MKNGGAVLFCKIHAPEVELVEIWPGRSSSGFRVPTGVIGDGLGRRPATVTAWLDLGREENGRVSSDLRYTCRHHTDAH
jgi:hypothetical protein